MPATLSALTQDTGIATSGSVLAFDFGEKRIGIAVGELGLGLSHPLPAINAERNEHRFGAIAALVAEWRPVLLVVGLPLALDGHEHKLSRLSRRFAQRLAGRFGIQVVMADERFTSAAASQALSAAGVPGKKQKAHVDSLAAFEILQAFLQEQASCDSPEAHP